ncbi:MAG: hypothetical protein OXM61_17075 [Candidatus Poribacteria bacterium]|nr:hypothetical protein [Candidatus Poribacteria bacterium]
MQFTYYWPVWAVILGIIITVSITVYGYLRIGHPLRRILRYSLIALRFFAIAILLCCLLAPVIIEKRDVTPISHLSILVDTSRSMQLEDNYSGKSDTSRMSQVNQLLYGESSNFLDALNNDYNVHLYRFDSVLYQGTTTVENFEPKGTLTNVASAIREAAQMWRGQPNAGIVLITDGAHNASKLLVDDIIDLNIPVYALGVGSPQPPKDIQIQNVDVLPVAYTGHETVIRVTVAQTGYATESIRVSLRESGNNRLVDASMITFPQVTAEQSVTLNGQSVVNGTQHVVELKLTPETKGNFQYKVILPALEGELTNANNEKTFTLKVVKAKLSVFFLEGRPRWEYAFLKRTLERDPNIESTFAVLSKRIRPESVLERNDGYYPQNLNTQLLQFPKTREELYEYDVLILGDLSAEHLTTMQQRAVVDFVEQRGKAVIFLPSHNALGVKGFRNTQLARILPIQIPANGCREQDGEFSLDLTRVGAFHPMLQLTDNLERNNEIWQNLPALSRVFLGFQLRAGTTTLIKKQSGEPILVFQRVGLGKSLLFAAEGIWNWDFGVSAFKGTTYQTVYPRFWAQVIRWMAQQSDENRIYITTTAPTYAQGETAQINVRAYSHTFQPQDDAEIQLSVTSPSGSTFPLKTRAAATENQATNSGTYTAQLKVEEKGTYRIQAAGVIGNIPLGKDEMEIYVHPQLIELETPQLNEVLLKELAEHTGGVYLTIEDAHSMPEKIDTVQNPVFVDTERDLWAHPLILITIVGLLGTEWFIRKRIGLV